MISGAMLLSFGIGLPDRFVCIDLVQYVLERHTPSARDPSMALGESRGVDYSVMKE